MNHLGGFHLPPLGPKHDRLNVASPNLSLATESFLFFGSLVAENVYLAESKRNLAIRVIFFVTGDLKKVSSEEAMRSMKGYRFNLNQHGRSVHLASV